MILSRHVLKYLYIYYLPSGLFVVVSWASFLIPPEVVPGRMAMLITLFLVLINIFNIVTSNSPNVEGMTAIAAWMLVCIFFVFGALVGYAYLLWKKKKSCLKRKKNKKQTEEEIKLKQIRKEDYRLDTNPHPSYSNLVIHHLINSLQLINVNKNNEENINSILKHLIFHKSSRP